MQGTIAALVLSLALGSQSVAAVNLSPSVLLPAGTKIACTLVTGINSANLERGSTIEIDATDPKYPQLRGAVIEGFVTDVTQARGVLRARIAFLFTTIKFANGSSESIHAYLLGRNVVERRMTNPTAMPPIAPRGVPSPSTMAVEVTLGAQASRTTPTGGYIYANKGSAPIVIGAGRPLTIELAAALQTP